MNTAWSALQYGRSRIGIYTNTGIWINTYIGTSIGISISSSTSIYGTIYKAPNNTKSTNSTIRSWKIQSKDYTVF